jgi:poly(3-hydroxybutyrate) depolymerase
MQSLIRLVFLGMAACLLQTAAHAAPAPLPSFKIALDQTSVSGLSGGGFMAVQFSVAYSSIVHGAGIIAGGPYHCARGDMKTATTVCTCTGGAMMGACKVKPGGTGVDELIAFTDRSAKAGRIDPLASLAKQKIWLFSGQQDSIVPPPVMDDLARYYRHFVGAANLRYRNDMPAQHTIPTDGYGNDCDKLDKPFISNCGFDAVGDMLRWIYGQRLQPRKAEASGRLVEFDQREVFEDRQPARHGMAERGFLYIPPDCNASGAACTLHIAFHGCKQDAASVGERFVRHAGYNRWADANRMLVLYPQAAASLRNPGACWDWWDFNQDDPNYADRRGHQMRAVRVMVDRLAGVESKAEPACFTATNVEHVLAGRAHDRFFFARANGSNQLMGPDNVFFRSTLKRIGPNHYTVGCD